MNQRLYSVNDTARILGMSRNTLRMKYHMGYIEAHKAPGSHLKFSDKHINDYIIKYSGPSDTSRVLKNFNQSNTPWV